MHGSLLLHSRPPSAPAIRQGVACIIPTVVAVCLRRLSRRLAKARSHRLHGPARQSLRQRQDRELHEDTQGRSRVSDGVRNLRGRYSRPSPLHRRGLQHSQTPLRARLSEPRAIRGSPRPATCQNRRLKLSTIRGALHRCPHPTPRLINRLTRITHAYICVRMRALAHLLHEIVRLIEGRPEIWSGPVNKHSPTGKKRRHRRRPPTAASLYHSPEEFAERARIGRATVWRMMKQGRLRYARFGRARRIPVTEYQRLTSDV